MVSRPLKDPRLWDPFHSWPISMDLGLGQGGGDPITPYDTWEDPPPSGLPQDWRKPSTPRKDQ